MKSKFFYFWMLAALVLGVATTVSCSEEPDYPDIWSELEDLDGRLSRLEAWQKSMNEQVSALKAIVEASQTGKTITNVEDTADGYTITFSDGSKISIKHGDAGEGGAGPELSVDKDENGYFWTINGEPLTDDEGNNLYVTGADGEPGVTPQLRVNSDGNWEYSTDGTEWEEFTDENGDPISAKGEQGEQGDSFFESVDVDDEAGIVTITLADGTEFQLTMVSERVLYFSNPGKQLDYDMDEDGHYTGLRSTTVICNLPEEEISAIMAQLLYPDENGDIVTRAEGTKKTRIEVPDEWDGTFKVYIDVQEELKAILEVRVAAMDGTEYIAARQLDTTPLIEFVAYTGGETVKAPNTFSAEVQLKFTEGIEKVKRLAIAAMPTVTVPGSYAGYDDGTEFRRTAQDCFGYFEKGDDLDPYIAVPYYVLQGDELKLDSDGYLHVDEDKLLFFANRIDGEWVYQQAVPPFRAGKEYTVATYVEYTDGGFDLINTTWTVPELTRDGKITPVFTEAPKFEGNIATAKVTAEGAAKLATFVVDDDAAFNAERSLDYYMKNYNDFFHAYEGEKEMTFTASRTKTYTFVAVAIDDEGKIGKSVSADVTYGITFGNNGAPITKVEIEQQTQLNRLKIALTADEADEVRFKLWDRDTWMTTDDRGARQTEASKLEGYFSESGFNPMLEGLKNEGGKWVSRQGDGEGIYVSLAGVTTPGFKDDTSGQEDERTEVPATGGGKFYIFFNTVKDGQHGDIYALYGDFSSYQLLNVTQEGYDKFTESESADTYVYTTALPSELAESGGDEEETVDWFTSENTFTVGWMNAQGAYMTSYTSFANNDTALGKVWVIEVGEYADKLDGMNDQLTPELATWLRGEVTSAIETLFEEYDGDSLPSAVDGSKLIATIEAPFTMSGMSNQYMYPLSNGVDSDYPSKFKAGSVYLFVGQDKSETEEVSGKLLYGYVGYKSTSTMRVTTIK